MSTHFPHGAMVPIIVALVVVMVRKANDNIDAGPRIENEFQTVVFMAIPVRRSMRGRAVSVLSA